jgi:hypothetical protein
MLARRLGPLSRGLSSPVPLAIVARPPRVEASRVRLEFRLRGAAAATAKVMIQRRGHRVRALRVRATRRLLVRPRLRRGAYRAWAQARDARGRRVARSKRVRFRVS